MKFQFKRGWRYAKIDKIIFQNWQDGIITAAEAIRRIAENNQCDEIPVNDFLRYAEELGYGRTKKCCGGEETE